VIGLGMTPSEARQMTPSEIVLLAEAKHRRQTDSSGMTYAEKDELYQMMNANANG
jgi:hypothetical protein